MLGENSDRHTVFILKLLRRFTTCIYTMYLSTTFTASIVNIIL